MPTPSWLKRILRKMHVMNPSLMEQVVEIEIKSAMMLSALDRVTKLSPQQQQQVDELLACCADENAMNLMRTLKSPPK